MAKKTPTTPQETEKAPQATQDTQKEKTPQKAAQALKNVHEAVLYIMERCPYIQKTGKVGTGSYAYKFASEADLINALHPLMIEVGLTLMPVGGEHVETVQSPSDKGNILWRTILRMTYRLTHAPSNTHEDLVVFGEGADRLDKTCPKAMTIAYKYAMRQAFNIETGDDPDQPPESPRQPNAQQAQTAPAPAQAAHAPAKPAPTPGEAFNAARDAVKKAPDVDALNKYREAFKKRSFTKAQIDELEKLADDREKELDPPEPPPQPATQQNGKKGQPAGSKSPPRGPGF